MSCLALAVSLLLYFSIAAYLIFLSPCSSALMLLTFIFPSAPLFRLRPSWTLLSPLVPVVQSPTNGAHYCCAKYSLAAKSGFFSCFPSFSHQNFPPRLPDCPRREMSNGEKACQLIYQLAAHVQPSVVSRLKGWGCGAAGPRQHPRLAGWLAGSLADWRGFWLRAHGTRWKWICDKPWTLPCGQAGVLNLQEKQAAGWLSQPAADPGARDNCSATRWCSFIDPQPKQNVRF